MLATEGQPGDLSIRWPEITRLLIASHELETAADRAEAGDITVTELARAARRTRRAAADLIAVYYDADRPAPAPPPDSEDATAER
ncbi:hypothetical protein [Nocardia yamanashiensis]|uniref:hypothetical protein n=1 Tax=Nocardia yamanashiensis TaxID=209247 RepID=UPI00082FA881|nr:hypothetical protein [Nocardia yamanashiensis]